MPSSGSPAGGAATPSSDSSSNGAAEQRVSPDRGAVNGGAVNVGREDRHLDGSDGYGSLAPPSADPTAATPAAAGPNGASGVAGVTGTAAGVSAVAASAQRPTPNPADPTSSAEREVLKLVLQQPHLVASGYRQVEAEAFTEPAYAAVHLAVIAVGGPEAAPSGPAWVTTVAEALPAGPLRSLVTALSVEPTRHRSEEPDGRYAGAILARMAERMAAAREGELRSVLQRASAAGDSERADTAMADLLSMSAYRRALTDRARGDVV